MLMRLSPKAHILLFAWPLRWKLASSLKQAKSKKSGCSSICWLIVFPKGRIIGLLVLVWLSKICIVHGNGWISWFFVHYGHNLTPLMICLPGKTSYGYSWRVLQHCLNVTMCFSVLTDRSRSVQTLILPYTLPVFCFSWCIQEALIVSGWSFSSWKVLPKFSISLGN